MVILITSRALAHPLHPIKSRSKNKRRNLWVDDVFPPDDLGSGLYTPFIIYIPYILG